MSEKTPIRALIEAVEAGVEETLPWRRVFGWDDTLNADAAHNGSLDAALALHEALLPGWVFDVTNDSAFVVRDGVDWDNARNPQYVGESEIPARAWLLAILRAHEVQHG